MAVIALIACNQIAELRLGLRLRRGLGFALGRGLGLALGLALGPTLHRADDPRPSWVWVPA
jgi:hypothetical protein